jgi:hypothetical protein
MYCGWAATMGRIAMDGDWAAVMEELPGMVCFVDKWRDGGVAMHESIHDSASVS